MPTVLREDGFRLYRPLRSQISKQRARSHDLRLGCAARHAAVASAKK
jgi:hypothetical protein